ncbi:peptidylprolyl isomerase [Laspinema palackyanum]|uniref:peptidylprolyl isomerase n=1 Tax=Laspinema palackyanum TaxID=3231601 RepID=UPI00345D727B|nr:peptidyl-prolyl cis-trans isomerase [Laspinema sp. D2c]
METEKFITIDDETISLRQALGYLRTSGDLQQFIMKILRQHVIEQELQSQADLEIDGSLLEQAIINFRLQNQLVQSDRFDQWLQSQSLTYGTFRNQFAAGLKIEEIKNKVTAEQVEDYFQKNQQAFEQVVLSRIVVEQYDKAVELKTQLEQAGASFEALAKEHSIAGERAYNGMMGAILFSQLPPAIREAISKAQPGDIVGPLELEGRYSLLRLEQRIPATLEGQLKRQLQEQLFEQWWQSKLQNKNVKLQVE